MAIKFNQEISLGNIMSALVAAGSMLGAWVSIETKLATHGVEIVKNREDIKRNDIARAEDKREMRELVSEVKGDIREVRDAVVRVERRTAGR